LFGFALFKRKSPILLFIIKPLYFNLQAMLYSLYPFFFIFYLYFKDHIFWNFQCKIF